MAKYGIGCFVVSNANVRSTYVFESAEMREYWLQRCKNFADHLAAPALIEEFTFAPDVGVTVYETKEKQQ